MPTQQVEKYYPLFFVALLAVVLATSYLLVSEIRQGLVIDTDLRALLPENESNVFSSVSSQKFYEQLGNKLIIAAAAPDINNAKNATRHIATLIENDDKTLLTIKPAVSEEMAGLFTKLTPYRFQLLTEKQKDLITNNSDTLIEDALHTLFSFDSIMNTSAFKDDPLNLYNNYIKTLTASPPNFSFEPPFLIVNNDEAKIHFVILVAEISENVLSVNVQEDMDQLLKTIENQTNAQWPDVNIMKSGVAFHASEAAVTAKKEIMLISTLSIAGIVLLYMLSFSSLLPLLLSLCSIAFGWLAAFALCHYIFSGLHIITLVFGATLIGVSIDYSLHYFTKLYARDNSNHRFKPLATIISAISLGLITSILGYGSLILAPLPGLHQVAVFSITGLVCSWLFVVSIYPRFLFKKINPPSRVLISLALLPQKLWHCSDKERANFMLAALFTTAFITCLVFTSFSDNPRLLHNPSKQLLTDEMTLQQVLKNYSANQFFVITGHSVQETLLKEETFRKELDKLINSGALADYKSISQLVPSIQTQQENYALLKTHLYYPNSPLTDYLASLGYEQSGIQDHLYDFEQHKNTFITPENWPGAGIGEFSLMWLGNIDNVYASTIMLRDITNSDALNNSVQNFDGVFFINKVDELSQILDDQQSYAIKLLLSAYIIVMVVLVIRYKNAKAAGLALVPLTSTLITLGLISIFGTPISLFHTFALFLILGLGLDYTIFLYEAKDQDVSADLAIMLSALTSALSFGLLAFSHTPMVSHFGSAILIGSLFNLILAPYVCRLRPLNNSDKLAAG